MSAPLSEPAPAKVNLTLRVLGKRADGYHDIESLVAFARFGDRLTLRPGARLDLRVSGPTAGETGEPADNLVLRAARALSERIDGLKLGCFALSKRLPAGAGLGGGSADAAAALRLLARVNDMSLDDPRLHDAARATGADVPVCLDPQPRLMRGIGDILSKPLALPKFAVVMVHPRVPLATKDVFAALRQAERSSAQSISSWPGSSRPSTSSLPLSKDVDARHKVYTRAGQRPDPCAGHDEDQIQRDDLLDYLAREQNDLEPAAIKRAPVIAEVLAALRSLPGCRLARMSGSGSACFALFESSRAAMAAARTLSAARTDWWIRTSVLGG